jgi:CBS domain-containing protein
MVAVGTALPELHWQTFDFTRAMVELGIVSGCWISRQHHYADAVLIAGISPASRSRIPNPPQEAVMKVRDVMTSNVVTATPETTLEEISNMMKTEDTGAIPVVDEGELIGIVTDRDIVIRCVAEGRDPSEVSAEEILSEEVEVVDRETDVAEALNIMGRRQVRRLPVVEKGELVGMVSLGDLAVKQGDEQDTGETLKDVSQGVKQSGGAQTAQRKSGTATRNATSKAGKGGEQGITNNLEEETRRQEQVVAIRPDANALGRGQKKSSKRRAS